MSLVSTLRQGTVRKYFEEKGFGFIDSDGEKFFFHVKNYRHVAAGDGNEQKDPFLKLCAALPTPKEGDVVVFWPDVDSGPEDTGKKNQEAAEWSFANVWNPAMVTSLVNAECVRAADKNAREDENFDPDNHQWGSPIPFEEGVDPPDLNAEDNARNGI